MRQAFPVLASIDQLSGDVVRPAYFDGPGGTQVHGSVVTAMRDALVHKMSNIGYDSASSLGCLDLVSEARQAASDFLHCESCEVQTRKDTFLASCRVHG